MFANSLKCIAFDADNTLYETRAAAGTADMAAMDVLRETSGIPSEDLYKEFLDIVTKIKTNPDPKIRHRLHSYETLARNHNVEIEEQMYAAFSKELLKELQPMKGIGEIIPNLAGRFELWVITEDNKPMTLNKLWALRIGEYFRGVISSDDTGVMKPSPKYFDTLLQKFKAREIMVVGDNYEKDLFIPEKLGMKTLLVKSSADLQKLLEL